MFNNNNYLIFESFAENFKRYLNITINLKIQTLNNPIQTLSSMCQKMSIKIMISDFRGLKFFILEHMTYTVIREYPLKNNYSYLKDFMNLNYKDRDFGYIELNDRIAAFKPISNEETFNEALKNITGQGMYVFVKKAAVRAGPWRCIRCQMTNKEADTKCSVCKLQKSN
jgi:hypothetical protein